MDVREELRRKRNDLSFLYSDMAHGGPESGDKLDKLRAEIAILEKALKDGHLQPD